MVHPRSGTQGDVEDQRTVLVDSEDGDGSPGGSPVEVVV